MSPKTVVRVFWGLAVLGVFVIVPWEVFAVVAAIVVFAAMCAYLDACCDDNEWIDLRWWK